MMRSDGTSVKNLIKGALMELMTEKSYMDISVTDIITKANVARASFYRNYNSVSDIIDAIVEEMSDEMISDIIPVMRSKDERRWREFLFEHFYRFKRKKNKMSVIGVQNMSIIFSRMDYRMQQRANEYPNETLEDKYMATGKMGLINNITKKWMDNEMQETPEEIINYIMTFIMLF